METRKETKRHFLNFDIAGFSYWEGCLAMPNLSIGTKLSLVKEENNFDPYSVAIYFGNLKLGFIPRTENKMISKMLEMGYNDIFEAYVQRVSPEEHTERQIGVIVYLKSREICWMNAS